MLLHGLERDPDFQYLDTRLLVSCPAGGSDAGGLFLLDFKHNALKKVYTGSCSGILRLDDRYIVTTDDNRLLALNDRFEVISATKHGKLDFHGIAALNDDVVLVAETAVNAIGCYNVETFERTGEIRFNPEKKDVHHINDLWLEGRTLYVSMFSPYNRWYINPVEKSGAIVAIDVGDFRPDRHLDIDPAEHIVVGGLFMPHSVTVHNGRLAYCDSMSFRAFAGKETPIQLAGFTRGLAIAGDTAFIGQSRMRHVLRIPHQVSNCMLDGGIYVYHSEYRISRFVPLPAQQVYQILILHPEITSGG